ncbi:hypothetical protein MASR1M107_24430 [Ignavibacteriales bacterium]
MKYDEFEKEIIKADENDELISVADIDSVKSELMVAARMTNLKNKRINIRLSEKDIALLKLRALGEGIPYQTLISSILHKYIYGV